MFAYQILWWVIGRAPRVTLRDLLFGDDFAGTAELGRKIYRFRRSGDLDFDSAAKAASKMFHDIFPHCKT
jgi:hypothetical protein